jgi:hypothetical protein
LQAAASSLRDFIFTTTYGRRPFSGLNEATARLIKLMRVGRHGKQAATLGAFRTRLPRLAGETVAELAIGHARTGITRVYDLHRFENEIEQHTNVGMRGSLSRRRQTSSRSQRGPE